MTQFTPENIETILRKERFGLFTDKQQEKINRLREKGYIKEKLSPITSEDWISYKESMKGGGPGFIAGIEMNDDEAYKFYRRGEKFKGFVQDPNVQKEALAIGGGIALPMMIPGGQPLAAANTVRTGMSLMNLIRKFPALSRIFASGAGETGGAYLGGERDATDLGLYAARGVAGQTLGEGLVKVGTKIFTSKGDLHKGAEEAIEQITAKGGVVTPGLASKHKIIDTLENIADSAIIGSTKINRTREDAVNIASDNLINFVSGLTKTADDDIISAVVKEVLEEGDSAWRVSTDSAYKAIDASIVKNAQKIKNLFYAGKGKVVPTNVNVKDLKFVNIAKFKKTAEDMLGLDVLDPRRNQMIKKILKLDDNISFALASNFRSELIEQGGAYLTKGTTTSKKLRGTAKTLAGSLDNSMETAARNLDEETLGVWRTANKLYKDGAKVWNDKFIIQLTKADPDDVFNLMIKGAKPKRIEKLRKLILSSEDGMKTWNNVQGEFYKRILSNSVDGEVYSGTKILGSIKKFGIDDRALKQLFPDQAWKKFQSYARSLAITQGGVGEKTGGGMFIQLAQGGLPISFLTMGTKVGMGYTALVLGAPKVIAEIFSNPRMAKALTVGLKAKPKTAQAFRVVSQLLTQAVGAGIMSEDEAMESYKSAQNSGFVSEDDKLDLTAKWIHLPKKDKKDKKKSA